MEIPYRPQTETVQSLGHRKKYGHLTEYPQGTCCIAITSHYAGKNSVLSLVVAAVCVTPDGKQELLFDLTIKRGCSFLF